MTASGMVALLDVNRRCCWGESYTGPTRRSRGEAADAEVADVDAGRRSGQHLGDDLTGGGRVLEAVPTEPDGEIEAANARRPVEDAVLVGRQRTQSSPRVVNARALERGNPAHRLFDGLVEHPPIHRRRELGRRADVARAHEDLALLATAVEA